MRGTRGTLPAHQKSDRYKKRLATMTVDILCGQTKHHEQRGIRNELNLVFCTNYFSLRSGDPLHARRLSSDGPRLVCCAAVKDDSTNAQCAPTTVQYFIRIFDTLIRQLEIKVNKKVAERLFTLLQRLFLIDCDIVFYWFQLCTRIRTSSLQINSFSHI